MAMHWAYKISEKVLHVGAVQLLSCWLKKSQIYYCEQLCPSMGQFTETLIRLKVSLILI